MSRAGYVLAGGASTRMGRDKALLPYGGVTLVQYVARTVAAAAGSATLVGDPAKYGGLGFPVVPDTFEASGPLAGLHAALNHSAADWNLVTACDMPALTIDFLLDLLKRAEATGASCAIPAGPSGRLEPLCAVYHRRCAPACEDALRRGIRKIGDAFRGLDVCVLAIDEPAYFRNCNSPEDWLG